jgi:hypothetical protein
LIRDPHAGGQKEGSLSETSTKMQVADPQVRIDDDERTSIRLWKTLGAVQAVSQLAAGLGAQTIHALERVRDERLYLAAGFTTFDEFLSKHPESPMSHDTFRRRVNLLESEGDITFDLLNSLNVSVSARLLLAGNISLDGDHIVINEQKGDIISSTRIPLSDRDLVVKTIVGLKKKADEQSRTIERGKKDFEKKKRRISELEEQLEKGLTVSEDAAPHARALVSVLGNFQILADECKAMTNDQERTRFAPIAFQRLAEAEKQLEEALGFKVPESGLDLSSEEIAAAAGE